MRVLIVTGLSGSGKSIVLNVLEDAGYAVVDNLPAPFIGGVVDELRRHGRTAVAVSVDARAGIESIAELPALVASLRRHGSDVQVLFLTADTPTLVQRYSETRRRHPLSEPGGTRTLEESIEEERRLLATVDGLGQSIDTSRLPPQTLRSWVRDFIGVDRTGLTLLFESFAFKNGVPLDADLVFDVRCLPNPHYDAALRPLTGRDAPVIAYLDAIPMAAELIDDIARFVGRWLPAYVQDNRSYLSVAIGCTGGQHRSVYVVEKLARRFSSEYAVLTRHRALDARTPELAA